MGGSSPVTSVLSSLVIRLTSCPSAAGFSSEVPTQKAPAGPVGRSSGSSMTQHSLYSGSG